MYVYVRLLDILSVSSLRCLCCTLFCFNDTATTEIYTYLHTLSLHDALPILASFVSLMNRLAMKVDGSVLLIGHPNKAGDSFSGSTAWENQVRSRLFMERDRKSTRLNSSH